MGMYQCRGHITAISKSDKGNFIHIKAITQFDYKKHKLNNDSNMSNVLVEVEDNTVMVTSPPAKPNIPPNYVAKGLASLIVPEEKNVFFPPKYAELVKIAYKKEFVSIFVVEYPASNSDYELVYIQVGPEND